MTVRRKRLHHPARRSLRRPGALFVLNRDGSLWATSPPDPLLSDGDVAGIVEEVRATRTPSDPIGLAGDVLRWHLHREPSEEEIEEQAAAIRKRRQDAAPLPGGPLSREEVAEAEERIDTLRYQRRHPRVSKDRARWLVREATGAARAAELRYSRASLFGRDPFDPMSFARPPGQPGPAKGTGYQWPEYSDLLDDYLTWNRERTDPPLTRRSCEAHTSHQTVTESLRRFGRDWKAVQQDAREYARQRRAAQNMGRPRAQHS